jgi:hypothetical protein
MGSNALKQASVLLALFAGGDGYKVEENGCLMLGCQMCFAELGGLPLTRTGWDPPLSFFVSPPSSSCSSFFFLNFWNLSPCLFFLGGIFFCNFQVESKMFMYQVYIAFAVIRIFKNLLLYESVRLPHGESKSWSSIHLNPPLFLQVFAAIGRTQRYGEKRECGYCEKWDMAKNKGKKNKKKRKEKVILHITHLSSFCPLKIDVALKIIIGSKSKSDISKIQWWF